MPQEKIVYIPVEETLPLEPGVRGVSASFQKLEQEQSILLRGGGRIESPLSIMDQLGIIVQASGLVTKRQKPIIIELQQVIEEKTASEADDRKSQVLKIMSPTLRKRLSQIDEGLSDINELARRAANLQDTHHALMAINHLGFLTQLPELQDNNSEPVSTQLETSQPKLVHPLERPLQVENIKVANVGVIGIGFLEVVSGLIGGDRLSQEQVNSVLKDLSNSQESMAPADIDIRELVTMLSGTPSDVLSQAEKYIEQMVGNFQNEQEPTATPVTVAVLNADSETQIENSFWDISSDELKLLNMDDEEVRIIFNGIEYSGDRFIITNTGYTTTPAEIGTESIPNAEIGRVESKYSGIFLGSQEVTYSTEDLKVSDAYMAFLNKYNIPFPDSITVKYVKLFYQENGEDKVGLFSLPVTTESMPYSWDGKNLQDKSWNEINEELKLGDQVVLDRFNVGNHTDFSRLSEYSQSVREDYALRAIYFNHISEIEEMHGIAPSVPNIKGISYKR